MQPQQIQPGMIFAQITSSNIVQNNPNNETISATKHSTWSPRLTAQNSRELFKAMTCRLIADWL